MARILVTRAEPDAGKTAARLAAMGHRPITAPLRVLEPVPLTVPAGAPDRLIATSRNAFVDSAEFPAIWFSRPIHCVGAQTAAAARAAGFRDVVAAGGSAGALVGNVRRAAPPGATLFYLAGEPRRDAIEHDLAALGYRVETLPRYRMRRVPALPDAARAALASNACDVVLHFSAETAAAFFDLAAAAGLAREALRPVHACLSPAVADEAVRNAAGGLTLLVAEATEPECLFALVHAQFAR